MQATKKILVPVDFSTCSENALAYAIQFAAKIEATIHVLNIARIDTEDTENPFMVERIVEEKRKTIRKSLHKLVIAAKNNASRFLEELPNIETMIEIGSVSSMISEVAKKDKINFIIMGTQGENSVSDRLLGNTASTVVKKTPCPLIIIPEGASFQSSIMMGFASNLSSSDPFEIWRAIDLLKPIKPVAIHCVHFSEKHQKWDDKLDKFRAFFSTNIPNLKINFHSYRTDDLVSDLNNFCVEYKINLMVMHRPSRSFWQALLKGSFTQEMSKHINVPLLILKEGSSSN